MSAGRTRGPALTVGTSSSLSSGLRGGRGGTSLALGPGRAGPGPAGLGEPGQPAGTRAVGVNVFAKSGIFGRIYPLPFISRRFDRSPENVLCFVYAFIHLEGHT